MAVKKTKRVYGPCKKTKHKQYQQKDCNKTQINWILPTTTRKAKANGQVCEGEVGIFRNEICQPTKQTKLAH